MQVIRPVGRDAGSKKYDILSAMMAHALAGDKHRQRQIMRLMALITARYNWQRNELSVGQREIARLWCVDERTVKREMARFRALGWLEIKRQGARGRVSVLELDLDRIMLDTKAEWPNIGEDFVSRVGGATPAAPADNTVVPFRRLSVEPGEGLWAAMRHHLRQEDAALFDAWFAGLADEGIEGGCLTLTAPTRFHATYIQTHLQDRLIIAARRCGTVISRLRVLSP
ncbi:DnaA N-terminal domain-containing protein [Paracoccus alcaliphilus]|uniref:DnaA N-terminal domain-containing protein n=1 Tax=Paracoccus alcaliphilus TaxID=34002 RepID=A0A1H8LW44_9RHOB|nr:DnaA N-terminal domain-containing protein [Paracoccus alcaliphilus]WCR20602.1 hypothetical protein JHW40_22180 [Paracoccus alcaliphilus]SEO09301.1 DnaA N-terminal domain-containing protein [Paracoccus alcaliphilus]